MLLHAYRLWKDFFFPPCRWLYMDIVIELCFMCEVFISRSVKCVTFLATACIRNEL